MCINSFALVVFLYLLLDSIWVCFRNDDYIDSFFGDDFDDGDDDDDNDKCFGDDSYVFHHSGFSDDLIHYIRENIFLVFTEEHYNMIQNSVQPGQVPIIAFAAAYGQEKSVKGLLLEHPPVNPEILSIGLYYAVNPTALFFKLHPRQKEFSYALFQAYYDRSEDEKIPIVKMLLKAGSNPMSEIVIKHCIEKCYLRIIAVLLEYGAKVSEDNALYALRIGNIDVAQFLLQNCSEFIPEKSTILHKFVFVIKLSSVNKLQDNFNAVVMLIDMGININLFDNIGKTAFSYAVIERASPDLVRLLLENNANPYIPYSSGYDNYYWYDGLDRPPTALNYAIKYSDFHILSILLEKHNVEVKIVHILYRMVQSWKIIRAHIICIEMMSYFFEISYFC